MDKTSLKRLGYGFSALVMALGTVAWYPMGDNASAAEVSSASTADEISAAVTSGTMTLTSDVTLSMITLAAGQVLTVDLNGYTLTGGDDSIFEVLANATLSITGNGTVTPKSGGAITKNTSAGVINVSGGTFSAAAGLNLFRGSGVLKISGGDFTAITSSNGGTGLHGGNVTGQISGGEFGFEPTTELENGKAAYKLVSDEVTTYLVADKSGITATTDVQNGDKTVYMRAGKEAYLYVFGDGEHATIIPNTDIKNTVTVRTQKGNALPDAFSFDAESGKLLVTESAAAGSYGKLRFTDLSGDYVDRDVYVYSVDNEDIIMSAGATIDPATYTDADGKQAIKITGGGANLKATYTVGDTDGIEVAEDGKIRANESGEYEVSYTMNDATETSGTFMVTVVPAESVTLVKWNLDDGELYSETIKGDKVYDVVVPDEYDEYFTVENDKSAGTAKLTLLKPILDDSAYYALGGVSQTLKLRVYNVKKEVAVEKGTTIDLATLAKFPANMYASTGKYYLQGVAFAGGEKCGYDSANGTLVSNLADGQLKTTYYTATTKGDDVIEWTLLDGTKETTTLHVYETAVEELDVQYVSLDASNEDGTINLTGFYTKANDASEVSFEIDDDDAEIEEDEDGNETGVVKFTTVGKKTVKYTETLAGEPINEVEMTVYVTGVVPETVKMAAGVEKTIEIAPFVGTEYGSVKSTKTTKGLNVTASGDRYTLSAEEAGGYELAVTVEEVALANDGTKVLKEHEYTYTVVVSDSDLANANDEALELLEGTDAAYEIEASNIDEPSWKVYVDGSEDTAAEVSISTEDAEGTEDTDGTEDADEADGTEDAENTEGTEDADDAEDSEDTENGDEAEDEDADDTEEVTTSGAVSYMVTVTGLEVGEHTIVVEETGTGLKTEAKNVTVYENATEEETYVVRQGETVTIEAESELSIDAITGDDYAEWKDGTVTFDATEAGLGQHTVKLLHQFSDGTMYTVKEATVVVYSVSTADDSEADENTTAETLAELLEEVAKIANVEDIEETEQEALEAAFGSDWATTIEKLQNALEHGDALETAVDVEETSVDSETEANIAKALADKGVESVSGIAYYDVSVLIKSGDTQIGELHELNGGINVAVATALEPETGYTRTYYVIHQHGDEEPVVLEQVSALSEATDGTFYIAEDGQIYIFSSKFSTFAVAYADTTNSDDGGDDNGDNSGDNNGNGEDNGDNTDNSGSNEDGGDGTDDSGNTSSDNAASEATYTTTSGTSTSEPSKKTKKPNTGAATAEGATAVDNTVVAATTLVTMATAIALAGAVKFAKRK